MEEESASLWDAKSGVRSGNLTAQTSQTLKPDTSELGTTHQLM